MSNDLISRKAVIQVVDKHTTEDGRLDDDISVVLEEIPTAYDVDAVLEEIQKRKDASIEYWTNNDDETAFGEVEGYCESMKIVRNGGKKE